MAFIPLERRKLLRFPGIGDSVLIRLESVGIDSIARLRSVGVEQAVRRVCDAIDSPAWANRRVALRRALEQL